MDDARVNPGLAAGPEGSLAPETDPVDTGIDYDAIATRSEADRRAGRLVSHAEVERLVEEWLAAAEASSGAE